MSTLCGNCNEAFGQAIFIIVGLTAITTLPIHKHNIMITFASELYNYAIVYINKYNLKSSSDKYP